MDEVRPGADHPDCPKSDPPAELKEAGRDLFLWLEEFCSFDECRPLVVELCTIADRLAEIRAKLAAQGVTVTGPRGRLAKNPLVDLEVKLSAQYAKVWRTLGLADKTADERRPVGRPGGSFNGAAGWWLK